MGPALVGRGFVLMADCTFCADSSFSSKWSKNPLMGKIPKRVPELQSAIRITDTFAK
jgi:hypothetical protein